MATTVASYSCVSAAAPSQFQVFYGEDGLLRSALVAKVSTGAFWPIDK